MQELITASLIIESAYSTAFSQLGEVARNGLISFVLVFVIGTILSILSKNDD